MKWRFCHKVINLHAKCLATGCCRERFRDENERETQYVGGHLSILRQSICKIDDFNQFLSANFCHRKGNRSLSIKQKGN